MDSNIKKNTEHIKNHNCLVNTVFKDSPSRNSHLHKPEVRRIQIEQYTDLKKKPKKNHGQPFFSFMRFIIYIKARLIKAKTLPTTHIPISEYTSNKKS